MTAPGAARTGKAERGTVVAATSAMVLLVLDSSIVGVMLPSIRVDLALGPGAQAWVVAVYLATLAVLLPVGGSLTDAWGAARAFVIGLSAFAVASLLCSAAGLVAGSVVVVVAGLVPIGVGIGLLLSPMTTAALSAAPADRRGLASGLVSTVRQVGGVAGVALLGVLTGLSAGGLPIAAGFAVAAVLCTVGTAVVARAFV
ncbi:MFS transporter [Actinomycetospora sp. C-140]